ncbi:uncharacterized protein J4E79_009277 [Alternaria viburni]|uniref:uncharacterized protein n=1 Tax=Alternaria viburni TaxID=566460 RepID=UPI0020C51604|nr:uncharacterized protein J4E79_009277 [Alternaria viburni]KAI4651081.1 hypothetical protein J4E79_009277 [Alternaria viburni]
MSRQIHGSVSSHDRNGSSALEADQIDHNDLGYAYKSLEKSLSSCNDWERLNEPIVDRDHIFLGLPHVQASPQYPCQINPWNAIAFDVYRHGESNPEAGIYDGSLTFPYGGIEPEPAFPIAPMAPVWDFNGGQDFNQSSMFITPGAQPIPASFPAMVSAPPAPAPAPAPAAANRIHCPHGCPATFGRGGEYRRHMMNHERPRYRCPMVDCPKTFSRADKLRDHAKKGHGGRNPLNL